MGKRGKGFLVPHWMQEGSWVSREKGRALPAFNLGINGCWRWLRSSAKPPVS